MLDGRAGFVISVMEAYGVCINYLKLYEMQRKLMPFPNGKLKDERNQILRPYLRMAVRELRCETVFQAN